MEKAAHFIHYIGKSERWKHKHNKKENKKEKPQIDNPKLKSQSTDADKSLGEMDLLPPRNLQQIHLTLQSKKNSTGKTYKNLSLTRYPAHHFIILEEQILSPRNRWVLVSSCSDYIKHQIIEWHMCSFILVCCQNHMSFPYHCTKSFPLYVSSKWVCMFMFKIIRNHPCIQSTSSPN